MAPTWLTCEAACAKRKDGNIDVDFDDVVIRGVTVIRDGDITWPAPPIQVSAQPQAAPKAAPAPKEPEKPLHPGGSMR
ncbi:pyridine nucleotide transhydrogenase subunit-alpha [Salmonella enterica subsp. enterica]|uniref:Pyridine nucleotide transhydrogenase subunit-alpha n=1 Tax=Salmonella enterica I TaxID=59201 RepID=A0A379WUU6_SALET|nr:pyridine nucleotide transhydrogenase subunit-alpha [Salmonella enterica subsp. enterica]